ISGNYDTPLDDPVKDALAALSAYFADIRGIPWHDYPAVPGQDRNFTLWHQEFTIGTGKECPGSIVMNETGDLIERTKAILKEYQESGSSSPPKYAPKQPIP